ncbi:pentatricopeptide repeat-containing protein At3g26540 [Prosopis cineraria]|uniref:pentatricopeptide repeat-containing protein At3g26540 n=1 Tax=Prosopis cineraria TaxID=364024 RepID=UPI00240EB544|nr:pentatricopeptide repeat-containing protein At3g26540 [Prosopis cineraria]XP_054780146.1 pentatricopeptide repeat-containing protein At3g26540 [Prosopis cineraria]XP_054780147.1 pentatricopeptide repeat-containing protein At3g26540 [Prosopis cineraria]XP_054780148.1 pentatricopeptide repeat-containing protein At3g26540 [Prosopis cineraria]XP_054780149.1 pentatricopeptide repeat-containing protein At3g26540 [Prosopis cineraria]XP_054780151.1 pentatricopeptide repeat-containing protein At3g26
MGETPPSALSQFLHNRDLKVQAEPPGVQKAINSIFTYLRAGRLRKAVSVLFAFPELFPYSLYAHLFQICSYRRAIVEARKLESHLVTFSPTPPVFLLNRAIETYGKCCSLNDARELFEEMPQRDGGSWNAMITAYAQGAFPDEALSLFQCMNRLGIYANNITFASILGSCAAASELHLSRQIHGLITKCGFDRNVVLGSSLVDVYAKCRVMCDARKMFNEIENPNAITWNVIVRRYLDNGDGREAIKMFSRMLSAAIKPFNFILSNALVACSSIYALNEGMQIHGIIAKLGFQEDYIVSSSLINMYVKCGELDDGARIFNQLGSKDLVTWTSIVSGYAMSGKTQEARKLFDEMPERNVISWNAMFAGYIRSSEYVEALDFVYLMVVDTKSLDHVTVSLILNLSTGLSDHEMGKQVHGYIYRHGYHTNLMVSNALLDMYGKCGMLNSARVWFSQMSYWRDMVSWNSLLTSYAHHQLGELALTMFLEMQWETKPNKYTVATLLMACANTSAVHHGKQIHGYIIRHVIEMDTIIITALIFMYCRFHSLEHAFEVFKGANFRDVVIWNCIIFGCCHNHRYQEALELFRIMVEEGTQPDHVTIQGILSACIEEGLVEFGTQCFKSMSNEFCILPRLEHFNCMIQLYSRHGYMDELENFLKTLPIEPSIPMLTMALDACKKHGYSRLEVWIMDQIKDFRH